MHRIKSWLVGVVALFCATLAYAAGPTINNFSLAQGEDEWLYFSYNLDDPNGEFFAALRDAVRGHNRVELTHTVSIDRRGLFGGNKATVVSTYYVAYDILRESFEIGDTPGNVNVTTQDESTAAHILLGLRNLPLVNKNVLTSGKEYNISVNVDIKVAEERSRWTRWLPLKWFGNDEINVKARYTAQ